MRCLIYALRDWCIPDLVLALTAFFFRFMMGGSLETTLDQRDEFVIGERHVFDILENGPAIGCGLPMRLIFGNSLDGIEQHLFGAGERLKRSLTFTICEHDRTML